MKSGLRGGFISVSYMCFPLNTWSMAPSIYWPTFATWVHKSGWRCLRAKSLQSCPSLCNPRLLCPWDFPGKSTGSGLSCPPPGDPPENLGYTWVYFIISASRKETITITSLSLYCAHSPIPITINKGKNYDYSSGSVTCAELINHGQRIGSRVNTSLVHLGADSYAWFSWKVRTMLYKIATQFSSVTQACPTFLTPWTAAHQASLSITNPQSLLKLMSIKSVMPSNHLLLCHPLLLPSIFPSIGVFSSESGLHIRWPKYWSHCLFIYLT